MAANPGESPREIVTTRVVDAPRDLVWAVWTDISHLSEWWGPNGFRTTTHQYEFKPGGVWRFTMHGPDGTDYENLVVYRVITPPELLAYSHGEPGDSEAHRFEATVTFTESEGKTRIVLRALFPSADARRTSAEFGAIEGGRQTLERFEHQLLKRRHDIR